MFKQTVADLFSFELVFTDERNSANHDHHHTISIVPEYDVGIYNLVVRYYLVGHSIEMLLVWREILLRNQN